MKTRFRNYILTAVALLCTLGLGACHSEEEMERHLLEGYCWEGFLPIYNYGNDYYSRFYFDPDGSGVEEVYINGRYDNSYRFSWGWLNDSYGVIRLAYRNHRYNVSYSCIDVIDITHKSLSGYFYENLDDYYYDYDHGFSSSRGDLYFTLRTRSDVHRHN